LPWIKKNALLISQSYASNFALYIIKNVNHYSEEPQA
jgi:hypothetical protein